MQEIEKEILDDYELKASELEAIRQQLYFIMDNTTTLGTDAENTSIKAYNYDILVNQLPQAVDLLRYKMDEMQEHLHKLYDAKRDTKEHIESRQA